jgi:hypothetical protein
MTANKILLRSELLHQWRFSSPCVKMSCYCDKSLRQNIYFNWEKKWICSSLERYLVLSHSCQKKCLLVLLLLLPLGNKALVKRFASLQFLNLRKSVGLLGRVISPSQGRYRKQTKNKHKQISMPWLGFEPAVPVFERAKTIHASGRAATVIGQKVCSRYITGMEKQWMRMKFWLNNSRNRDHMGEVSVNWRIILKWLKDTRPEHVNWTAI